MNTPAVTSARAMRAFYFCHLTATGVAIPFFPHYLKQLGFSGQQLALVLSAGPLMHLFTPLVWGWFADRSRRPALAARMAALGAAICYAPLAAAPAFLAILLLHIGHQFFATALPGLADSLSITRVRHAGDDYGRIRVWGSGAFVLACFVTGHWLTTRNRLADPLIPLWVSGALLLTFIAGFGLRGTGGRTPPRLADIRTLLGDRRLSFLLVTASIHWGLTAPFHGFYAILLEDRGLSPTVISYGFVVSVVAEMAVFFYFRRVVARFSLPKLLALSTGVSALRWYLTATIVDNTGLVLVQALHGFTFGVYWATVIAWLGACVPENLRATGQTLLTASAFGVGNLLGTLGAGALYDLTGSAVAAFEAAALLSLLLTIAVLAWGGTRAPVADA